MCPYFYGPFFLLDIETAFLYNLVEFSSVKALNSHDVFHHGGWIQSKAVSGEIFKI